MSVAVLSSREEIEASRRRLAATGLTKHRDWLSALSHIVRTGRPAPRPDPIKSWDVEQTLTTLMRDVSTDGTVLDLGAYNSAILPALHRAGFRRLVGVDLDPRVRLEPYARRVAYRVEDFHNLSLPDGACDAVTAISTIEHGWRGRPLLREVARVLARGGLFLASTDYWPEKIDTTGVAPFGMSWTIFSADEIRRLLAEAKEVGLEPTGAVELEARDAPITWSGRSYTFALLTLKKV